MKMSEIASSREDSAHEQDHKDHQTVTVKVFAPRKTEPKVFTWDKHMLVGAAASEAANAFEYPAGAPTLVKNDKALNRDRQLVAEGVRDGDELELTDIGGGV
jgi:hypothetical protein